MLVEICFAVYDLSPFFNTETGGGEEKSLNSLSSAKHV
jgi:hypothetical protein